MTNPNLNLLQACQPLQPLRIVPLGDASSANCVNTCIYRHHGVVTRGEWQFTAWFVDAHSLVVAKRRLTDDWLETFTLTGTYEITDAHNSISLGIDSDGYLHIAYDHHGHQLHYRRSLQPLNVLGWTGEMPMTGVNEDKVTYPYFLMMPSYAGDREGLGPLLFLYRDKWSGNGDVYLKAYDTAKLAWSDRPGPVLKGTEQQPWTTNAYWNTPAIDAQGTIHLTFTWRINNIYGDGGRWFNKDTGYLKSDDLGLTWKVQSGDLLPVPVTPAIAEVIWPIPPFTGLINQCCSAIDSEGQLHVVYYGDDTEGFTNYHHLWRDGGGHWHNDALSHRKHQVIMSGGGFLQLPLSRPDLVIDRQRRIYVIYRGDLTGEKLVAQRLDPPDYRPPGAFFLLWDQSLEFAEPIIDRIRWERDGILSIFLLPSDQAQFDRPQPNRLSPAVLADFRLD